MTVCMTCNHWEKVTVVIESRLQRGGREGGGSDSIGQRSESLQLKQEAMGSIPGSQLPWVCFFVLFPWLTNVDEVKDLWCSSAICQR